MQSPNPPVEILKTAEELCSGEEENQKVQERQSCKDREQIASASSYRMKAFGQGDDAVGEFERSPAVIRWRMVPIMCRIHSSSFAHLRPKRIHFSISTMRKASSATRTIRNHDSAEMGAEWKSLFMKGE